MPYIYTNAEGRDNETSIYKYNGYLVSARDAPHFYEYVDKIIRNLNQGIYDEHAEYNLQALCYGYDEDGYELYDMLHSDIDEAVCELTYKECDKFICEIGLMKAIKLYEDCGYEEIPMSEIKELSGIRKFMYCMIVSCIEMHDDMEYVDEDRYKIIFGSCRTARLSEGVGDAKI